MTSLVYPLGRVIFILPSILRRATSRRIEGVSYTNRVIIATSKSSLSLSSLDIEVSAVGRNKDSSITKG